MASLKVPFKVYLSPEIVRALQARHPGYGEAGRVVKELIEAYVLRTKPTHQTPVHIEGAAIAVAEGTKHHG